MPRDEDIAWQYVERLEGKKWCCSFCGKVSSGQVTRVKSHLGGVKGNGIDICTKVPDNIRDLMLSLLKKEAEERSRQANHQSFTEGLLHDMPMPMQFQNVHQDVSLTQSSLELMEPWLPMPGGVVDMASFTQQLTSNQQSQGECQFCQSSTVPSLAQNQQVASSASQIVLQSDCALNPKDMVNLNQPGCMPECPSCSWQTGIGTASACPQYQVSLPPVNLALDNIGTSQQPALSNHRLDAAHGNKAASSLQQHSVDLLASFSLDPSQLQALLEQPTHLETRNEKYDHVLDNRMSNGLQEFIASDVLPHPRPSNITPTSIPHHSNEQHPSSDEFEDGIYSRNQSNLHDSLPENRAESRDVIVNTSEEIQMIELHNPTVRLSSQNHSSLDVDSTNHLQDYSQPCVVEVLHISPTNTVQPPEQLHPTCDKECGNDTCSFPSQTPMDIDPSIASQHTGNPRIFEATVVNLQLSQVATNTTGPSSSSVMNRGSPIMNVRSTCTNHEEIKNLKRKVEELECKEADIKELMESESAASSVQKKPRKLVEKWLKETERAKNNFQMICQANVETFPPKEELESLTREVEGLIGKTLPQTLLIEVRDAKGDAFLERKLIGKEIHRNIEFIWDRLKESDVCRLGIYGMGGVGKTTIMMHIHNRLIKDATFDGVLFITMSQDFSIYKLQSDIWKALKFDIMEDEHEKKRAAKLLACLENKKNCVVILDDVWQHFKLQDVGIPDRAGLKVVLTTRFSEVCSRMDCEEIKIQPLGDKEAWKLFMEELGPKSLTNTQVEKVARKIANRCAGLPLAINTMARSMRGEKNFIVWRDTLNQLERSHTKHTEMGDKVLPVLRLSYERLSDPQVKQCFLLCALFPEGEFIKKMQLIEYFIDEGSLDESDTREEQYHRGLAIVDVLRNACLLEVDHGCVRMHDLIRNMALQITGTAYMVKGGHSFRRTPDGEFWTKELQKVSLMGGWNKDIPLDLSPNCPELSTLLLNRVLQQGVQIHDPFFMNLRGLKVLNISECGIRELPDSFSELSNLRALLLQNCWSLCRIPYIGKLKYLRKLDANGCRSLSVVEGLEELRNLRYLDLSVTRINKLKKGTLRRMVNLQYLKIVEKEEADKVIQLKADEVIQLKALERLECCFGNVDDFNKYVRFIELSGRHDYSLFVDTKKSLWFVSAHVYSDPEILPENKIEDQDNFHKYAKYVKIESCNYAVARVGEECNNDSIVIPENVEFFEGRNCCGMTSLDRVGQLQCLRELQIEKWDNLVVLFGGTGVDEEVRNTSDSPASLFPSLETLKIQRCSQLKYLFGHESRISLPRLHDVVISECKGIEGITTSVLSSPQLGGPAFPRLERIFVTNCGNLRRVVGSEWLLHFPNLTAIGLFNCNNIREVLPHECLLHLPNLECIYVSDCKGIEEMFSGRGQNHGGSAPLNTPSSSLPSPFSPLKLKILILERLPQLKSIGEGALSFIPGAIVSVEGCPKLRSMPPDMFRRCHRIQAGGCCPFQEDVSRDILDMLRRAQAGEFPEIQEHVLLGLLYMTRQVDLCMDLIQVDVLYGRLFDMLRRAQAGEFLRIQDDIKILETAIKLLSDETSMWDFSMTAGVCLDTLFDEGHLQILDPE